MYVCMCYMCMFVYMQGRFLLRKISNWCYRALVCYCRQVAMLPYIFCMTGFVQNHMYIHTAYAALLKLARITFMQWQVHMLYPPSAETFAILCKDPFKIVFIQHMVVSANTSFTIYLYSVRNSLGMVIQRCRLTYQYRSRAVAITDT